MALQRKLHVSTESARQPHLSGPHHQSACNAAPPSACPSTAQHTFGVSTFWTLAKRTCTVMVQCISGSRKLAASSVSYHVPHHVRDASCKPYPPGTACVRGYRRSASGGIAVSHYCLPEGMGAGRL